MIVIFSKSLSKELYIFEIYKRRIRTSRRNLTVAEYEGDFTIAFNNWQDHIKFDLFPPWIMDFSFSLGWMFVYYWMIFKLWENPVN